MPKQKQTQQNNKQARMRHAEAKEDPNQPPRNAMSNIKNQIVCSSGDHSSIQLCSGVSGEQSNRNTLAGVIHAVGRENEAGVVST